MKNLLTIYFSYTRKERTGIIVLLFILLIIACLPAFFQPNNTNTSLLFNTTVLLNNDSIYPEAAISPAHETSSGSYFSPPTLFFFDPNTANANELKKLGLKDRTIATILKYRSQTIFRQPEDLRKIYNLNNKDYERLKPFIKIQPTTITKQPSPANKTVSMSPASRKLNINKADSLQWESLYGIGPILSKRIVKFRETLGGFYSIEQLKEVHGLPDTTFQHIKLLLVTDEKSIDKIALNSITAKELSKHPYFRQYARMIIAFREEHGKFVHTDDLLHITALPQEQFNKMKHYISLE